MPPAFGASGAAGAGAAPGIRGGAVPGPPIGAGRTGADPGNPAPAPAETGGGIGGAPPPGARGAPCAPSPSGPPAPPGPPGPPGLPGLLALPGGRLGIVAGGIGAGAPRVKAAGAIAAAPGAGMEAGRGAGAMPRAAVGAAGPTGAMGPVGPLGAGRPGIGRGWMAGGGPKGWAARTGAMLGAGAGAVAPCAVVGTPDAGVARMEAGRVPGPAGCPVEIGATPRLGVTAGRASPGIGRVAGAAAGTAGIAGVAGIADIAGVAGIADIAGIAGMAGAVAVGAAAWAAGRIDESGDPTGTGGAGRGGAAEPGWGGGASAPRVGADDGPLPKEGVVLRAVAGMGAGACLVEGAAVAVAAEPLAPLPSATMITPPQTEHRARTPLGGTRAGSTRNTDRHSGHVMFTCPPLRRPHRRA